MGGGDHLDIWATNVHNYYIIHLSIKSEAEVFLSGRALKNVLEGTKKLQVTKPPACGIYSIHTMNITNGFIGQSCPAQSAQLSPEKGS